MAKKNDTNTTPRNTTIVIFGASGDLTKRKLVPATYYLWKNGQMPEKFSIIGISRTEYSDDDYRQMLHDFKPDEYGDDWDDFKQHIHYVPGDATKEEGWKTIEPAVREHANAHGTGNNFLFYLSMAPQFFEPIIEHLGNDTLLVTSGKRMVSIDRDDDAYQRIVVEKPFGHDPESARSLNEKLDDVFHEHQIYRIDHYLGKELVMNLLVLRFANTIFEPIWNRQYVDHVQITASETVGVEGRGSYYDGPAGGAMRDMVQSHLLQVLSVMAMEPPNTMAAEDIRTEKIKIFKALRVPKPEEVPDIAVRGQYGAGAVGGENIPAYRDEQGTDEQSQADTYAAMKFHVDTWRWGGVPFYLRSGKALTDKRTDIVLYFKPTPHILFREQARKQKPNQIVINVQPNEGVRIRFEGKVPGLGLNMGEVVMDFDYVKQWQVEPGDGYAVLLNDVIRGDQTLFKHRDEVERSWDAVQPVLDYWQENPHENLPNYNAGTWGPSESDIMLAKEDRAWHNPR